MESDFKYRKVIFILGLSLHIGLLVVYKYLTFITTELSHYFSIDIFKIDLPIGISFFSFQMMSYLIDVYRRDIKAQNKIMNLMLYLLFFPQLIAGPIVRYSDISTQLDDRRVSVDDIYIGINRFIIGLGKKVILSDGLALIADNVFSASRYMPVTCLGAWLGAITFTLQIYFDFSGYSDMAIGLARVFGFRFKENFNYPYVATSITEFWTKWHISLTDWFREYVYIPLGGNRVKCIRHIMNLMAVWILTGIWHGANWTFLIWGINHGIISIIEKFLLKYKKIPNAIGWCGTMLVVIVNWVIFKADSIEHAVKYLYCMVGWHVKMYDEASLYYLSQAIILILIASVCCVPWKQWLHRIYGKIMGNGIIRETYLIMYNIVILMVLFISLSMIIAGNYSPFIYYNF